MTLTQITAVIKDLRTTAEKLNLETISIAKTDLSITYRETILNQCCI